VPMKQLAQFQSPRNRSWFTRPGTYWYARVWGGRRFARMVPKPRVAARHAGRTPA
jgi:hypothetical protein